MKKYVTVKELLRSDLAKQLGIDNGVKEDWIFDNLLSVAQRLSFLRMAINAPIYVNSGYRCERLNEEVYGSPKSLHMKGLAADIRTDKDKLDLLKGHVTDGMMKKILRIREVVLHDTYVHIGFEPYDCICQG